MLDPLAQQIEESLLATLEQNLSRPVTTKTPVCCKFSECEGERIFTLLRFEATLHG